VGHEIPTALLPNLLTVTLGAPAGALGLIEGVSDGLAGAIRRRRRDYLGMHRIDAVDEAENIWRSRRT